jgi:hypothetical protein
LGSKKPKRSRAEPLLDDCLNLQLRANMDTLKTEGPINELKKYSTKKTSPKSIMTTP